MYFRVYWGLLPGQMMDTKWYSEDLSCLKRENIVLVVWYRSDSINCKRRQVLIVAMDDRAKREYCEIHNNPYSKSNDQNQMEAWPLSLIGTIWPSSVYIVFPLDASSLMVVSQSPRVSPSPSQVGMISCFSLRSKWNSPIDLTAE